jgi:hypothetical protein
MNSPARRSLALAIGLVVASFPSSATCAVLDEVAAANAVGKPVFLLVSDGPGEGLETARRVAREAQGQVPTAVLVELDRRDPNQAQAVAKFRVAAAPVPLVIVIASNGVATGAARPHNPAAAQRLVSLIPSPKKADYLKILSEQRIALVAASKPDMAERGPLYEALGAAVKALEGRAQFVLVDLGDAAEEKFLADLKIAKDSARPVLVVVNPKGLVLGTLLGAPTAEQIVTTSRKTHVCNDPNCKECQDREKEKAGGGGQR